MTDDWVVIKSLDDLAEAEWVVVALRDVAIPARLEDRGESLSIFVKTEQADAARERLLSIDEDDEGESPVPADTAEEEPASSRLVSNSRERERYFYIAYGRAFLGIFFPPWIVSAIVHLWKGWREPEPIATEDLHQMLYPILLILTGLVFWISIAVSAVLS